MALPIQWDGERPSVRRVPPKLGEHTDAILGDLGYTPSEIERLERQKAIQR